MMSLGTGTGGNFGDFKRKQDFTYTTSAVGMSKDQRSDPNMFSAYWTPAPNTYDISKGGSQNEAPKYM
jgi:hypothetical protein